jgi:hypothetical protein
MIGRHLTTQNRVAPPKKPKKDKGHHKDEGHRQQRITGKAVFSQKQQSMYHYGFHLLIETGTATNQKC